MVEDGKSKALARKNAATTRLTTDWKGLLDGEVRGAGLSPYLDVVCQWASTRLTTTAVGEKCALRTADAIKVACPVLVHVCACVHCCFWLPFFAQAKLTGTKGSMTAGGALGQLDLSRQAFNYLSAARVQHVLMTKWEPEPVPSSMTDLLGTIKVNFEESWTSSASSDFQNLCRCSNDAESWPQMIRTHVYFLNNS